MDTREKIVATESALSLLTQGNWIAVSGLFDPLTIAQAKRLSLLTRNGQKLLVIVERGDNPLLDANARALLIAALKHVDTVTIADSAQFLGSLDSGVAFIEDAATEAARSKNFIEFVLERQRTAQK